MKLDNALVVLDIESTGTWVEKDRIIEIALIKYSPDGKKEVFEKRVNPGMPIPPFVVQLTGISDADVKEAAPFKAMAQSIIDFIGSADMGGFNIERFDLPLLERECADAGFRFEWKNRKIYDAQKVFHLNEKRDLSAAYQFYCGQELVGAHSARADSEAVYAILEKQIQKYCAGSDAITGLDQFEYTSSTDFYGEERKFCWWDGKLYLMFGKYARKLPLEEIVKVDTGYLTWILKSDFSDHVKNIIRSAMKGDIPVRSQNAAPVKA